MHGISLVFLLERDPALLLRAPNVFFLIYHIDMLRRISPMTAFWDRIISVAPKTSDPTPMVLSLHWFSRVRKN